MDKFSVCVILAGGKSSRMGVDKTLLPYSSFPTLTHFCYERFSEIFSKVFVSAKSDKFSPPLPLIKDSFSEFSPMGALYSVLLKFQNERVFIISADMPFVKFETISELFKSRAKISLARDSEFIHSLCGFYDSSLSGLAGELFDSGIHKIGALFDKTSFETTEFSDKEQFLNINYPKDYKKALENLKKEVR